MLDWTRTDYEYRLPITLVDPLRLGRRQEPVRLDLVFDVCRPHPGSIRVTDKQGADVPTRDPCPELCYPARHFRRHFIKRPLLTAILGSQSGDGARVDKPPFYQSLFERHLPVSAASIGRRDLYSEPK